MWLSFFKDKIIIKVKNKKQNQEIPEAEKVTNQEVKQSTKIRLLKNPTGFTSLANNQGDVITVSPDLTKKLVDNGYAEYIN